MRRVAPRLVRATERARLAPSSTSCARTVLPRPPSGPSCSRWLSCTCCRPTPFTRTIPAIPPLEALQHMKTPHLPLPPPLPWSPDSQPFLRHLQILALALRSPSADESWDIYQALHPEIRPAIPDDIFVSLIAHQLEGKAEVPLWERLSELLALATQCNMDPSVLGPSAMEGALEAFFEDFEKRRNPNDAPYATLDWLWAGVLRLRRDSLATVSVNVRKEWLSLMSFRYRDDVREAHRELERMVDHGGGQGIASRASRIVAMYRGPDIALHKASLRLAAWCLARGVKIRNDIIRDTLDRLRAAASEDDSGGLAEMREAAQALVDELAAGGATEPAATMRNALDRVLKWHRTPAQVANDLAADPKVDVTQLVRALRKLDNSPTDLEAALNLCIRSVSLDSDPEPLLRLAIQRLNDTEAGDVRNSIVVQLASAMVGVHKARHFSPALLARLLYLVTSILPSDDAYSVAFKLYPLVRANKAPDNHRWRTQEVSLWRRLFDTSLKRRHLHFASRLYADLQADGLTVPRGAALAFIRAISGRNNASRFILLDRHIKDYLWDGDKDTDDLVIALAEGLASTGSEAAALAVRMAQRIRPTMPPRAIEAVLTPLATSSNEQYRTMATSLLDDLPSNIEAQRGYDLVLSAMLANVRHVTLDSILQLYRSMTARGIPPSATTTSTLIAALLKSDNLELALAAFNTSADAGQAAKTAHVGSLMVNLAMAGRSDEAYKVEDRWRALFPENGPKNAKAVAGARLAVDIKASKPVDLTVYSGGQGGRELVAYDGYKPNRPFYEFLTKLQRERGLETSGVPTEETVVEAVEQVLADVEAVTAQPEPEDSVAVHESSPGHGWRGKPAVQPVTQSWSKASGGTWLLDRERERRGVQLFSSSMC